jgi:hypothetical protein
LGCSREFHGCEMRDGPAQLCKAAPLRPLFLMSRRLPSFRLVRPLFPNPAFTEPPCLTRSIHHSEYQPHPQLPYLLTFSTPTLMLSSQTTLTGWPQRVATPPSPPSFTSSSPLWQTNHDTSTRLRNRAKPKNKFCEYLCHSGQ